MASSTVHRFDVLDVTQPVVAAQACNIANPTLCLPTPLHPPRVQKMLDDDDFPPLRLENSVGGDALSVSSCGTTDFLPEPAKPKRTRLRAGSAGKALAKDRLKFLDEVLVANIQACGGLRGKLPHKLRANCMRIATSRGVEEGLLHAKMLAGVCRQNWIERNGTLTQAQSSFIGRALPTGSRVAELKAIAEHKACLSSVSITPDDVLKQAKSFSTRWARRFLGDPRRAASPGIPTLSSCCESGVKKQGLRGHVVRLGPHPLALDLIFSLNLDLPEQDVESLFIDSSLLLHGLEGSTHVESPHRVSNIKTRGLKNRIVTTPAARYSLLGHIVRKRLLGGLKRDPSSQSTLIGVDDVELMKHFVGCSAQVVVSTDLKAATDLLPLDLMSSIVDGLAESGKMPAWEISVLRELTEPQTLLYNDGTTIVTTRGILMGLPTTWVMLSLVHIFWWNQAIVTVAKRKKISLKQAFTENRFVTCGDDALFCGWSDVAHEYNDVVSKCGGTRSAGKHFAVFGREAPRSVFIERLFQFTTVDGRISGGSRVGAIPLCGLVRPEIPEELRGHGSALTLSNKLKLLLSVDSCWQNNPNGLGVLRAWLSAHQWLRDFGVGLGLVDGLPLSQGGNGCPPKRGGLSRDAKVRRYISALHRSTGETIPSLIRGLIDPYWRAASVNSKEDVDRFIASGTFIRLPDDAPGPDDTMQVKWCRGPDYEGLLEAATERLYFSSVLNYIGLDCVAQQKKPNLHERQLTESIRKFFRMQIDPCWNLDAPPQPPSEVVWVQRTRSPSGNLLYPQWAGEALASEDTLRGTVYSLIASRYLETPLEE